MATKPFRLFATVAILLAGLGAQVPLANAGQAPYAGAVNVVPSAPRVGSCIPFANNVDFGFAGFVYRNVPAFTLRPGTEIAFDLAAINDVDVRRDIYFSAADHNPGPGNGNVRALAWTKVVSDTQVPSTPRGNTTVGDYELRYRAEQTFAFGGGGLVIGFGAAPPSEHRDGGCEQVGVHTSANDASAHFFVRFWGRPDRDLGQLDRGNFSTTFISGFVVFTDTTPPVVSATVSPSPGPDGWVDAAGDAATVTWSGADDGSGVASCDAPVQLTQPGIHELTGSCTDHALNVGTTTLVVQVAHRVALDVMPGNPLNPLSAKRRGSAFFAVRSGPAFDATRIDVASMRLGATGDEQSIESCSTDRLDLRCRFDVAKAGAGAERLVLKGFVGGVRVIGSDAVRVAGPR